MALSTKIKQAKEVLSEAFKKYEEKSIVLAWSGHKDSTVLVDVARNINPKRKIRAFINITGKDFPEAIDFVVKMSKRWSIDLIKVKNPDKALAIEIGVTKFKIKAIVSAIRSDENPARQNETYFSPRRTHMRVHPLLDFNEKDIWDYIKKHKLPYLKLYDQGYRSLGEKNNTSKPSGDHERSGRSEAKEKLMFTLRELGYW